MAYASQAGRARVSSTNPEAQAVCDRCGIWYNFNDLQWQFDWRGATLQNIRILVCSKCLDVPQEQLRAITLPADPLPIINARPENLANASTDYFVTGQTAVDPRTGLFVYSNEVLAGATAADVIVPQPIGPVWPPDDHGKLRTGQAGDPLAQAPFVIQSHWGEPLALLSVVANGTSTILVTCSSPHGLATGAQIGVLGVSSQHAAGLFNVTVITATAFTYMTQPTIPIGSLLEAGTLIVITNAGVPWGMQQTPQVGI